MRNLGFWGLNSKHLLQFIPFFGFTYYLLFFIFNPDFQIRGILLGNYIGIMFIRIGVITNKYAVFQPSYMEVYFQRELTD